MLSSLSAKQALQNLTKRNDYTAEAKSTTKADSTGLKDEGAVQLKLSDDAKKWSAFSSAFQAYQVQHQEDRKAKSRERLEEIKRRIQELKQLLMMFGSLGAKALLRELKQLSGELKQVAKDMQEGSGNTGGALPSMVMNNAQQPLSGQENTDVLLSAEAEITATSMPPEASVDDSESGQTEADTEESNGSGDSADTVTAETQQQASSAEEMRKQQEKQRQDDIESLKEAVAALKSLLSLLKSMLRSEDVNKDTQKQLKEITQLINDTEKAAQQSGSLGAISGGDLSMNISIDVSVTV